MRDVDVKCQARCSIDGNPLAGSTPEAQIWRSARVVPEVGHSTAADPHEIGPVRESSDLNCGSGNFQGSPLAVVWRCVVGRHRVNGPLPQDPTATDRTFFSLFFLSSIAKLEKMAPAPWDAVPAENTLFVLVTGGNRYASF
jgi:hypothetical protein